MSRFRATNLVALLFLHIAAPSAQTIFTQFPTDTVYIPPPGYPVKTVRCRTNVEANISWIRSPGDKRLDEKLFNIARESETTSVMNLVYEQITGKAEVAANLTKPTNSFYCKAGTVDSKRFKFAYGAIPALTSNPTDVAVNEGTPARFTCTYAMIQPHPSEIVWKIVDRRGNVKLANETSIPGRLDSGYDIPAVSKFDAGDYACAVTNEFDTVYSTPATLEVLYFEDVAIRVTPALTVPENTEVTLQCTIDANPAASDIQIRRNDEVVYSSRDSNRSSNDLGRVTASGPNRVSYTFSASSNWKGKLRCYGVNTAGSKQQSVDFLVQTSPDAPTLCVNGTSTSTDSLTYAFLLGDDGGSVVTRVSISCYRVTSDGTLDTTVKYRHSSSDFGDGKECVRKELAGLTAGTTYGCQLFAANDVGHSEGSARFDGTTQATAPSRPTLDSNPVSATETTLEIHWTVAYNGGKPITRYIVRWTATTTTNTVNQWDYTRHLVDSLSQQEGTYTLDNLSKGTQYSVQVLASNAVDTSTSAIQTYTTLCIPGPIEKISLNDRVESIETSIKLVLTIPSISLCGAITEYVVTDVVIGMRLNSSVVATNGSVVTLLLSGLTANRRYSVRVGIENDRRLVSKPSENVTFMTSEYILGTQRVVADDEGLGTTEIAGIIVAVVVAVTIGISIVVVLVIRSSNASPNEIQGLSYKMPTISGYDENDTKPHPGPNSGSTYSYSLSDTGFLNKDFSMKPTVVYTEVELKEEGKRPIRNPSEKVEYATIDREASRKRREKREAEMKKFGVFDEVAISQAEAAPPLVPQYDEYGCKLSTLV